MSRSCKIHIKALAEDSPKGNPLFEYSIDGVSQGMMNETTFYITNVSHKNYSSETFDIHALRKDVDSLIYDVEDQLKGDTNPNINSVEYRRALSIVRTKLQEAKMWFGKALEAANSKLPEEFRDECEDRK